MKTVLITGAASGIGKACALRMAKEGYGVVVADLNLDGARAVVEELTTAGGRGIAIRMDVADEGEVEAGFDRMMEKFHSCDLVMSNAGVIKGRLNGKFDPYANITRGEFATIAARFLSDPYVGEDYYTDISAHWAREYINRAAAAGWVRDFDQPFRPNDYITRAEVMSLVNAMIGRTPDKDHMHEDMIQWPDNMDTTKWYYEDVQEATNSHEYVRIQGGMENWTKVLPVRDWKAIEAEWASIYDATNPGDVMDGVRTKS